MKSIKITLWNDLLESRNICLLDKDFCDGKIYTSEDSILLNSSFEALYDEYFKLLNNRKAKAELEKQQGRTLLQAKIIILHECIETLLFIGQNKERLTDAIQKEIKVYDVVTLLSKYVKFGTFSTISENIAVINKILTSAETEFQRKFTEEPEKERYTFERQVADVEQVLGRPLLIDILNVVQWIEYINKAQEIIKYKEKENGKHRK